jgi:hypothetical protein
LGACSSEAITCFGAGALSDSFPHFDLPAVRYLNAAV